MSMIKLPCYIAFCFLCMPIFAMQEVEFYLDEHEEYELVEKPEIPQLELTKLDTFQKDQESKIFCNGQLVVYNKYCISDIFKEFSTVKQHGMRALFRYVPKNYDANKKKKPELVLIVHGTSGRETSGYYDLSSEQFQNFVRNVAQLAYEHEALVDIYSYEWSGINNDTARLNAGRFLSRILNGMYHYYSIMRMWPHSHGLGPVLGAVNNLLHSGCVIECDAMGSPILEGHHIEYAPHVDRLFNFTSEDDVVQFLGYWWSTSSGNSCRDWQHSKKNENDPLDKGKLYKNSCHGWIANIHYTYDDYSPGHSELPYYLSKNIWQIVQAIEKNFKWDKTVLNLAVNVVPDEESSRDEISVMLYPFTQDEEKYYLKELPSSMLVLSEKNKKEYVKKYGSPKKLPYQMGYWDMACAYGRKCYKLFK